MAARTVDDVDEQDATETERLIATALAGALASTDPATPSPMSLTAAPWPGLVQDAIGLALKAYLVRTAFRFLTRSGVTGAPAARVVDEIVPAVHDEMVTQIADGLAGTYQAAGERLAPGAAVVKPKPQHELTADIYRRVRVGSARLAQTGTTRAREMVRSQLAEGLGAEGGTWRTRKDDRVRLTHGALEGETRPLGEPFVTVDGSEILYPGDPAAPIGETANCRCRLAYLVPTTVRTFQRGESVIELTSPEVGPVIRSERTVPV